MKSILNSSIWGRYPFIIAILIGTFVYGQGYSISGRTYNEAGKKIGSGQIILYDLDKKKVADFKTPGSGKFKLKNIQDGNYTINLYADGGYSGTEKVLVSGSDVKDLNPILKSVEDQTQISTKPIVMAVEINWRKPCCREGTRNPSPRTFTHPCLRLGT